MLVATVTAPCVPGLCDDAVFALGLLGVEDRCGTLRIFQDLGEVSDFSTMEMCPQTGPDRSRANADAVGQLNCLPSKCR